MSELPQPGIPPLTLGTRCALAMRHARISREQMAHHIGVDPSTISRWCGDDWKRPPSRGNLLAWADLCNVDTDWLIDGKGNMPVPPAPGPGLRSVTGSARTAVKKAPKRRRMVYKIEVAAA